MNDRSDLPSSKENPDSTVYSAYEQNMMFELEEKSWWFQYRAQIIILFLQKYFNKNKTTTDIGGGNGYTTYVAAQNGFLTELLEPSRSACENASKRGVISVCGMMSDEYPEDDYYEQAMLLDVLEHIEDDCGFLNLLHRKMKKGGMLLITVPASMYLWNSQDVYAGHYRRYDVVGLERLFTDTGFRVHYINYFFSFLFLPHLIGRRGMEYFGFLKRNEDRDDEERREIMNKQFTQKEHSFVMGIIRFLENNECRRLIKKKKQLFGSSIILVAEKK